jgi:hypothetical protein
MVPARSYARRLRCGKEVERVRGWGQRTCREEGTPPPLAEGRDLMARGGVKGGLPPAGGISRTPGAKAPGPGDRVRSSWFFSLDLGEVGQTMTEKDDA